MTLTSDRTGEISGVEPTAARGRLTPEVVRQSDFPRSQLGRRGYNEADVERFRNRVVLELVNTAAEKAELRQEIQRLRDYYRRQGIDADGRDSSGARAPRRREGTAGDPVPSVNAVNVMSQAQQAADQHIAQAEEYARRLVNGARAQYEKVLLDAHEQAEKAAQDVQAAEQQRARVQALARRADRDGETRLDPVEVANLRELASRLTYMRTFAQVTQVQLRSILDALSDELDHFVPTGTG